MKGGLLPQQQTLRDDSGHEDKRYWIGNHGAQTSSVEARGHKSLRTKTSNNDKKRKKRSFVCGFR